MSPKQTKLIFILDRSGSMAGLETDTIGGFNSLLAKQKALTGSCFVSTILFNEHADWFHDRVPIRQVPPLTADDYVAGGSTALYDAIGTAIHHVGNQQKYAAPGQRADQVLVVIITDGYENSSVHYRASEIRQMITRQKQRFGWQFIFLGANIDAEDTAGHLGIGAENASAYVADKQGTELNYAAMERTVTNFRASGHIPADALMPIRHDAHHRG
ncbi:vWA domain-containing protein [Schleiferilactobacillus shenzhenensis]|uniref:VWFA domain-containing protein n=1 Tax=Schleiferilactobacillus shenzhenensis LY-73 TaxID=1231336 RepID=U4TID4_9LACO|nr:hypothetical protein [Schleiferilactobacillus shenzhenensis]ERL64566.1 hypothetical protein L248_0861 [Schleiferilactobacillus shenzhenensis LY-73]